MTYKAINTLDSMVGYKTEKYRKIGLISAKMDDLANLIPARLTWLFLILSSQILLLDVKEPCKLAGGIATSMPVPTVLFGGSCGWSSGDSAGRTARLSRRAD